MISPEDDVPVADLAELVALGDDDGVAVHIGDGERAGGVEAEALDVGGGDVGLCEDGADGLAHAIPDVVGGLLEDAVIVGIAVGDGGLGGGREEGAVVLDEASADRASADVDADVVVARHGGRCGRGDAGDCQRRDGDAASEEDRSRRTRSSLVPARTAGPCERHALTPTPLYGLRRHFPLLAFLPNALGACHRLPLLSTLYYD